MAHVLLGLFTDTKQAGEAVAELKSKGYTKDISLVAKNPDDGKTETHSVKQDGGEGTAAGATAGAVVGGAGVLLAGITAIAVPGVGLVAGAIATALTAAATGAVTGGLVGYLVDKGIPDNKAKEYQDKIQSGDVLVAAEVDHENESSAETVFQSHGALEIAHAHND